ncbi:MAG: hypothetical protein O6761_05825 [Thaumarchaeota archaeon]|nr:hypothetical protein [Nitrososphaerota archaeon]
MDREKKSTDSGAYLKPSYIIENKITELKIVSDGELVTFEDKNKKTVEKLQCDVTYEGYDKSKDMPYKWTLNQKSENILIDAWGGKTQDWKNKPIPITINGDGDYKHILVDALRIK